MRRGVKPDTSVLLAKGTPMGIFKQLKDAKDMVEAAPEMLRHTQTVGARAHELLTAPRAAAGGGMASLAGSGHHREPVALVPMV